jgi:O-acetyl-ADP-ribose deacetylase (regulator of RNase III)
MAKVKNKPRLTNKQIENHLNNLYHSAKQESYIINTVMKVFTDFVKFTDNTEKFEAYLKEKYKKPEEEKKKKD